MICRNREVTNAQRLIQWLLDNQLDQRIPRYLAAFVVTNVAVMAAYHFIRWWAR